MKKIIIILTLLFGSLFSISSSLAIDSDVRSVLGETSTNRAGDIGTSEISGDGIQSFIINIGRKIMLPIVIVIGILIAILGFYKMSMTDKEDERKKGINFFIWGTLGVIIMISAWFITNNIVLSGLTSNLDSPAYRAAYLYEHVIKKFFLLVMYVVLGILFIMLLISVIKFMTTPESEDTKKHSKIIIIWNTIGILIIIFSKDIVEMVYKKLDDNATNLGAGGEILETKEIPWLYTIINYVLGFIAFVIMLFIIYQAYLLLTKPDDEDTYKKLKRYFVYAIWGVFFIGGVYLLVNFIIIKPS